MKTNKKAILGMLAAMIMSLGVMGGINSESKDMNLSQLSVATAGYSDSAESAAGKAGLQVVSGVFGALAVNFYVSGAVAAATGVGVPVGIANGILGFVCTM